MNLFSQIARKLIRQGRRSNSAWAFLIDNLRQTRTREGLAELWTKNFHRNELHQVTTYTERNRYPHLFDLAAALRPDASRILSFGCSTGEEIEAIRSRFSKALIFGAEINPRSRKIARARFLNDKNVAIRPSYKDELSFDIAFAMAVLQFRPHLIKSSDIADLSKIYPFSRFANEVENLVAHLAPAGLLCVMHTQYRVEDTKSARALQALSDSPRVPGHMFGTNSRLDPTLSPGVSLFIKH